MQIRASAESGGASRAAGAPLAIAISLLGATSPARTGVSLCANLNCLAMPG